MDNGSTTMTNNILLWFFAAFCVFAFHFLGRSDTLTEYFDDGSRILWNADAGTQTVHSLKIEPSGKPEQPYGPPSFRSSPGCVVANSENWICPAVTVAGGINDGAPDPKYGFTQAVDGEVSVTDSKMLVAPVSLFRWQIARLKRLVGISK